MLDFLLNFLFKPGQLMHGIYIVLTGKTPSEPDCVECHMNLWVMSTMFWTVLLFLICWLMVLQVLNG